MQGIVAARDEEDVVCCYCCAAGVAGEGFEVYCYIFWCHRTCVSLASSPWYAAGGWGRGSEELKKGLGGRGGRDGTYLFDSTPSPSMHL